jgi:hypothetical protein
MYDRRFMMRGVFIYYRKIEKSKLTGIDKKVLCQIDNFKNNKLECKLVEMTTARKNKFKIIKNALAFRLPYGNAYPTWEYIRDFDNIDFLYFRRPSAYTVHMINTLTEIKQKNPGIKIIMEIPTYPYDKELMLNAKSYPLFIKDVYNREKLKAVIDRIALISGEEHTEVFGIPVLRLYNGINLKSIRVKSAEGNNTIDLCAVG